MTRAPEVKGVWFVTARRYILQRYGEAKLHAVSRAAADGNESAILEPLASAWYHEDVFQDMMRAVMSEICANDPHTFAQFLEECTVLGVNTFFRILLRITSVSFLMRKMPGLSKQYRRNDSICTVEADDRRALLKWERFPYFDDRNYRIFLISQLVKTAELCTGARPKGEVLEHGPDTLTAQVTYG